MLVQYNVPLAVADELTPLIRDVFPDSKIAQNFSSRWTKTACMINGAIAPFFSASTGSKHAIESFSVSNWWFQRQYQHRENESPYCPLVWPGVRSCAYVVLDMCLSSSASAEGIFSRMDEALSSHHIRWENCIGMGLDNTSVNMGCRNSIKTRVLQKNSSVYMMGCPCHIIHNTAEKAGVALSRVSIVIIQINLNALAIIVISKGIRTSGWRIIGRLIFWFDKSTKRKASLVEYCTFCDTEYRKIIKHVNTRWLSLERAVQRVLQQFDPLKSYFLSEGKIAVL